ncbi:MAG: ABC transporter permease [Bdellovibrionaceae bacterium]|nr:ABC transporter permease [Pseudobdellovibrionaceae bacterium]
MSSANPPVNDTATMQRMEQAQSMKAIVFRQFLDHRLAVVGAVIIAFLLTTALCAPLISALTGLSPESQNVGARYLLPFQKAVIPSDQREIAMEQWINAHPGEAAVLQKALIERNLATGDEEEALYDVVTRDIVEAKQGLQAIRDLPGGDELVKMSQGWERFHVFGTDEIGRDVFIRLIYGARVSIGVGLLVAFASGMIGFLIGSLAGFYGGLIDAFLMRVTDALLSLPIFPVLIVFAAIDLNKIPWLSSLIGGEHESIFKMVMILCLFSWMTVARLVRGSILSLREREFILAARTLGARDRTIIARHLFPNVIAPMIVAITLGVGESILFEAALSFLGLGIMPPAASWGNMLNNAQEVIYNNIWLAVLPGLMILITVVSFNFLGDGLQDAMDPKSIRR